MGDDWAGLLPGVRVEEVAVLGGSNRSVVRRVRAGARPLIVKQFTAPGDGWARESAALSVLPPAVPGPRLVAASAEPPVVVMTDLGDGPSVADALLGDDPLVAQQAVVSWAEAIAGLHRGTAGLVDEFTAALRERAAGVDASPLAADLAEAAAKLGAWCAAQDVDVPAGAWDELAALPTGAGVLTPADACPDNNVRTGDGLVLLDFEGAQWRPAAWDVAYLRVPWPSCWCSWRLPEDVAAIARERYRALLSDALPYVCTEQFPRDVEAAAVGWALVSTSWSLPRALADDPPLSERALLAPTRRAMILHRLAGAGACSEIVPLAELARRLRTALVARWGEVPLAYAPAFRQ